jgi:hypothetical protein
MSFADPVQEHRSVCSLNVRLGLHLASEARVSLAFCLAGGGGGGVRGNNTGFC